MSDYTLEQLINLQQLEKLLEAHTRISGMACGLMDNDQNIIVGAGLQQVCTQFLWEHPDSFARCWRNDPDIRQALDSFSGDQFECRCKNGMINIAMPIVIEGNRLAIFFSGQFFYDNEPPDLAWFQQQAEKLGFDTEPYLAAVRQVPLFSRSHVDNVMRFLHQLVQLLAETGYANLRRERELEERKQTEQQLNLLNFALDQVREGVFLKDIEEGRFLYVNQEACHSLGYNRDELIGMSALAINPNLSAESFKKLGAELLKQGSKTFESTHQTKSGTLLPVEISATIFAYNNTHYSFALVRDITERRQTEQQIKLLNHALDNVHEGAFLIDLQGRFLYVNQEACRSLGYTKNELCSMGILDINPDSSSDMLAELIADELKQGTLTFETRHRTRDGQVFPVEIATSVFAYGDSSYLLSLVRDITERKHAEQVTQARLRILETTNQPQIALPDSLRLMLDELEALTSSSIAFYHFLDEDQQTLSLQGWSSATMTTFCRAEGAGSHYPVAQAGVWADAVRERRPVIHNQYATLPNRQGLPEGHAEVIRELVVPIFRRERIVAIIGVGNKPTDYTEADLQTITLLGDLSWEIVTRKQAEKQIKLHEREFRTLAENSPDNIVRYDSNCRMIYLNPRMEKTLGVQAAYLLGKTPSEKPPGPERSTYQERIKQVLATGEEAEIDLILPDTGEGERHHNIRFVAERDDNGSVSGVLAIGRDITERKQAEQRLYEKQQRLNDMALELTLSEERERRRIAVDLHDTLGQDLTLTRMKLGGLKKTDLSMEQSCLVGELDHLAETAIKRVRRLTRLLSPPILESAGLEAALKWLARQLETDYHLNISFFDDQQDKPISREHQMELYNSVRELLINVAKHAETSTVCLSVGREADLLVVQVEDDGTGFDVDLALSNPVSDGFGLFTIKRRMLQMNGSCTITSRPGSGTEVIIRVPLLHDAAPQGA